MSIAVWVIVSPLTSLLMHSDDLISDLLDCVKPALCRRHSALRGSTLIAYSGCIAGENLNEMWVVRYEFRCRLGTGIVGSLKLLELVWLPNEPLLRRLRRFCGRR
ncbi:hypothetical protein DFJ73DRAFT_873359 [Zopfochytrium polystomum]|nr:hypothetical protein DFJ73DRAFT_873359 [Zopfochytrium polystomum]